MSRETLDRLKAQIAEQQRIHGENAPAGFRLPWKPPTGGHDSPNLNDERTHNGKCWRSLMNGNTSEPSDTAQWWEEIEC